MIEEPAVFTANMICSIPALDVLLACCAPIWIRRFTTIYRNRKFGTFKL